MEASQLRMYGDNVLVRIEREQWLRPDGRAIVLPDTAQNPEAHETLVGVVVSAGPGYYPDVRAKPDRPREPNEKSPRLSCDTLIPTEVKQGERVLIDGRLAGERVYLDGVEHRVVREAEILAVVE